MRKSAKHSGIEIQRSQYSKTVVLASVVALQLFLSTGSLAQSNEMRSEPTPSVQAQTVPQQDSAFSDASAQPDSGFFSPERPRLIVLVHGATAGAKVLSRLSGKLAFARFRWDFPFVRALLGTSGDIFTFSGVKLTSKNWPQDAVDTPGYKRLPKAAVSESHAKSLEHHFISTLPARRDLSVLLTHRDGSLSLEEQAQSALDQIFEMYNKMFVNKDEPQIFIVAHSMGGLVARYILSNPYPEKSEKHFRADFIRNRTVGLVTLATPHEGSPQADRVSEIIELMEPQQYLIELDQVMKRWKIPPSEALAALGFMDVPAVADLRVDRLDQLNRNVISPEKSVRYDGSLIPVYAFSGRDPSAGRMSKPNLPRLELGSDLKAKIETAGLILADQALKRFDKKGWGVPVQGSKGLDRVKRMSLNDLTRTIISQAAKLLNPCLESIIDDMGGVRGASGLFSFSPSFPVYLNRNWNVALVSTEIPFKHWECGELRVPWEKLKTLEIEAMTAILVDLGYRVKELTACANRKNWKVKDTIKLPTVGLTEGADYPSDGEIDSDGLVGVDSGLGLRLGRKEINYFEHDRKWTIGTDSDGTPKEGYGSWYRFYSGPWDGDNHGTIVSNREVGDWIYKTIVVASGPQCGADPVGTYTRIEK